MSPTRWAELNTAKNEERSQAQTGNRVTPEIELSLAAPQVSSTKLCVTVACVVARIQSRRSEENDKEEKERERKRNRRSLEQKRTRNEDRRRKIVRILGEIRLTPEENENSQGSRGFQIPLGKKKKKASPRTERRRISLTFSEINAELRRTASRHPSISRRKIELNRRQRNENSPLAEIKRSKNYRS